MRMLPLAVALLGAALAPCPSEAHAFLRHAEPSVGATLQGAPGEVRIDFTEAVEPSFSSITVENATGERVDEGKPHTAANDPKRLIVAVTPLKPGTYKVIWHVISVDTHRTEGSYQFTVAP